MLSDLLYGIATEVLNAATNAIMHPICYWIGRLLIGLLSVGRLSCMPYWSSTPPGVNQSYRFTCLVNGKVCVTVRVAVWVGVLAIAIGFVLFLKMYADSFEPVKGELGSQDGKP